MTVTFWGVVEASGPKCWEPEADGRVWTTCLFKKQKLRDRNQNKKTKYKLELTEEELTKQRLTKPSKQQKDLTNTDVKLKYKYKFNKWGNEIQVREQKRRQEAD